MAKIRPQKAQHLLSCNNAHPVESLRYPRRMLSLDALINSADLALRTLNGGASASRPMPRAAIAWEPAGLTADQRRLSGALMW